MSKLRIIAFLLYCCLFFNVAPSRACSSSFEVYIYDWYKFTPIGESVDFIAEHISGDNDVDEWNWSWPSEVNGTSSDDWDTSTVTVSADSYGGYYIDLDAESTAGEWDWDYAYLMVFAGRIDSSTSASVAYQESTYIYCEIEPLSRWSADDVSLVITDGTNTVRTFSNLSQTAGIIVGYYWDGTDNAGNWVEPGDYTIEFTVEKDGGSHTKSYTITVLSFTSDPGDSHATATEMDLGGGTVYEQIDSSTDEDWYEIQPNGTGIYSLSLDSKSGSDLDWYLYGSDGMLLIVSSNDTGSDPEEGTVALAEGGTYYLKVIGKNQATGIYSLSTQLQVSADLTLLITDGSSGSSHVCNYETGTYIKQNFNHDISDDIKDMFNGDIDAIVANDPDLLHVAIQIAEGLEYTGLYSTVSLNNTNSNKFNLFYKNSSQEVVYHSGGSMSLGHYTEYISEVWLEAIQTCAGDLSASWDIYGSELSCFRTYVAQLTVSGVAGDQELNPGLIILMDEVKEAALYVPYGETSVPMLANEGELSWSDNGKIKVYLDAACSNEITDNPKQYTLSELNGGALKVYIKPIDNSDELRDVSMTLKYHESEDKVNMTICALDLDVDSDNNNGTSMPDKSPYEDEIENDATKPGKIFAINHDDDNGDGVLDYLQEVTDPCENDMIPIVLKIPLDAKFDNLDYIGDAGDPIGSRVWSNFGSEIKIWPKQDKSEPCIESGQHYFVDELGFDSGTNMITLWVEGITAGTSTISASIDIESKFVAANTPPTVSADYSDTVRLTVVEIKVTVVQGFGTQSTSPDNRFAFTATNGDAQLKLTLKTNPVLDSSFASGLTWDVEDAGQPSIKTYNPNPPLGSEVECAYAGLPANNSDFGKKKVQLTHSQLPINLEKEIEFYYAFAAKNWPEAEPLGHVPEGLTFNPDHPAAQYRWEWTNWYYYYSQVAEAHRDADYDRSSSYSKTISPYDYFVGNIENYPNPRHNHIEGKNGGEIMGGIDCFAWASRHEKQHHVDFLLWWPNGHENRISGEDDDYDMLKDDDEPTWPENEGGPFTPGVTMSKSFHFFSSATGEYTTAVPDDDCEFPNVHRQESYTIGSLVELDWAYPGTRWQQ